MNIRLLVGLLIFEDLILEKTRSEFTFPAVRQAASLEREATRCASRAVIHFVHCRVHLPVLSPRKKEEQILKT